MGDLEISGYKYSTDKKKKKKKTLSKVNQEFPYKKNILYNYTVFKSLSEMN